MAALNDDRFIKVGRMLVELLEVLERPSPYTATCSCGWRGEDWADEADAQAEAWSHSPCFGPYHAFCSCGWRGAERIEQAASQVDWEEHLAGHHA